MRNALTFALLAGLIFLTGCGETTNPDGSARSPDADAKYTIAVVPKGLGHQFWFTVREGAEAAGKEFNTEILWNGPAKETEVAEQINILQDMISRKVDAIVMAACDENALVDTIKNAMEAGIPVVTIDSGVKSDLPISFVATDNTAAAKLAAAEMARLIGNEGEVGQIPFVPGAATSEMREHGFNDGLKDFPNIKLVATIHCNSDMAKAMAAMEDMMTANPNLKGVFCGNEAGAIGAVAALDASGKAGQIKVVAFDASPEQVAALERGAMHALILQDPFRMGHDGVKAAIDHIEGRPVEKRIDTGVVIVTKENLHDPKVQALINPKS